MLHRDARQHGDQIIFEQGRGTPLMGIGLTRQVHLYPLACNPFKGFVAIEIGSGLEDLALDCRINAFGKLGVSLIGQTPRVGQTDPRKQPQSERFALLSIPIIYAPTAPPGRQHIEIQPGTISQLVARSRGFAFCAAVAVSLPRLTLPNAAG